MICSFIRDICKKATMGLKRLAKIKNIVQETHYKIRLEGKTVITTLYFLSWNDALIF